LTSSPVIGVSAGRLAASSPDRDRDRDWDRAPRPPSFRDGADRDYGQAVLLGGASAVVVPAAPDADHEAVVSRLDGLLLTGGGDVDPARYGAAADPATVAVDPVRDEAELALLAAALDRGIPVLALCRGCQLLNVHFGGTLHQDLPAGSRHVRRPPEPRDHLAHEVAVEPGSRLEALVGTRTLEVNSRHHQAVDRVGGPLRAVGWAPDGVVEAVEVPGLPVLGVQWHPENLVGAAPNAAPHLALFRWLAGGLRA
jgi:putative glutamine amidotransferase